MCDSTCLHSSTAFNVVERRTVLLRKEKRLCLLNSLTVTARGTLVKPVRSQVRWWKLSDGRDGQSREEHARRLHFVCKNCITGSEYRWKKAGRKGDVYHFWSYIWSGEVSLARSKSWDVRARFSRKTLIQVGRKGFVKENVRRKSNSSSLSNAVHKKIFLLCFESRCLQATQKSCIFLLW